MRWIGAGSSPALLRKRSAPQAVEPDTEGSRLICWATTDNGQYLYWVVSRETTPTSVLS
ncbi:MULTISPECIES: hypothetical protein [unclassified Streptomyces]|uniref:hypothetical protein n=1 Tax=unclassified Streptomyces TaxID=2593676 RepID=UPI00131D4859|nr:hypothetical protein [Streptomyces sp. CB01635]